jgi:ribosomal protein S18 acetylase RimI-like enzyme
VIDPVIRLLDEADAERLKPFRIRALTDGYEAFHSSPDEWDVPLDAFRDLIRSGHIFAAVADGGALRGMAMLGTSARTRRKVRHKCELWSVYVAPEACGRGLARRLVQRCIDLGRALGYEAIVLSVTSQNTPALARYESLGFVTYGVEKRHLKLDDGRYLDDVLMELDLLASG